MQTTCNHCNTTYLINKNEIETDDGNVVCSVCTTKFNAFDSIEGYEEEQDAKKTKPQVGVFAVVILALLLLPLQMVFFEKEGLLKQPTTRALVRAFCAVAPCVVPPYRDTSKIQLINRKVHSHPVEKSALIITATVINNAGQSQPFPKILISMADIHGKVHAQRLFNPVDYLPENVSEEQNMASGIPLNINLEIEDPGQNLIAFEIDFL